MKSTSTIWIEETGVDRLNRSAADFPEDLMMLTIQELQAYKAKAKRQRDNWKCRALLANDLLDRWLEWARMHGHLEHAEGIVKDSRELLANDTAHRTSGTENNQKGQTP